MYAFRIFLMMGLAGVACATGSVAWAGTFSSNFNSGLPARTKVYGSAAVDRTGGLNNSGVLRLTKNEPDQEGSFIINELDPGSLVGSMTVSFRVRIGGGTGADGFSFNFAPDLPEGPFGEEGAGLGLTVSFDTFDNVGGEAPAIHIKARGRTVATKKFNPRTGGNFVDVLINVDPDGTIDVVFGGTTIYSDFFAFIPTPGAIGFGARTRDATDEHFIDDLSITTKVQTGPLIRSALPRGQLVRPDAPIEIEIEDFATQVNPASIKMLFDGSEVKPAVNKGGSTTFVRYEVPRLLDSASEHTVELTFEDDAKPPRKNRLLFRYEVVLYETIPASFALPAEQIERALPGFRVRTVQARGNAALPSSIARAEAQLAGTLIDPTTGAPFVNEAIPGINSDNSDDEPSTINYDQDRNPAGEFLDGEKSVPGIPGRGRHTENFAVEILSYLDLPAGYHNFGVNSDEGFKATIGENDARDAFSRIIGQFDGGRVARETLFSVLVEKAGIYPFRLIWFEGLGPASLEFYSVQPDGKKVLVNDQDDESAIKSFRTRNPAFPSPPYVQFVSPRPNDKGVSRTPRIEVVLRDGGSKVALASVGLKLNGAAVRPDTSKNGGLTTIRFQPSTALASDSMNTLELTWADDATPPRVAARKWEFRTARVIRPVGQWDFTDGTLAATIGQPLQYPDGDRREPATLTEFGSTTTFGIPDIGGQPARVMKYNWTETPGDFQPGYVMQHCIPPNGGGLRVNQWTLVMDMLFPDPQQGAFTSLIQLGEPASDGELFVRWNNLAGEGTGGVGTEGRYTGSGKVSVKLGQWHRLAFAVDLAASTPHISKFIDGVKFEDQELSSAQLDGRYSMSPVVRLFADNDNDLNTFFVSSIQVLDGKLTDDEIVALGGASADGIPVKVPPQVLFDDKPPLSIQLEGNDIILSWPFICAGEYKLEVSDNLGNPSWKPVPSTGNSAKIRVAAGEQFYRLRR